MRRALLAGLGALALVTGSAGAGPNLVVGAAENTVVSADPATAATQLGLATGLGLEAVRITATWSPGQTAPDPVQLPVYTTTAQQAALRGIRLYLEVYPATPSLVPADDTGRAQFAQYLSEFALALPQVRDYVIGSQVNNPAFWPQDSKAAASYLALLAASYDALKSIDPSLQVIGGSLNSQAAPGTWVLMLGQAYRRSGRTTAVMDALAIQPQNDNATQPPSFIHPKGPIGIGDYPRLVANLKRAFDRTAQPGATLPIIYDGYGVQTTIPPEKASLYSGTETDAVDEQTQGAYYAQALQLAACQPNVIAFLFQHMFDEQDLAGAQTGLYFTDLTPKSDFDAVQTAIAATAAGKPETCQPTQQPTHSSQPTQPPRPILQLTITGTTATLSCDRPCYYVAILANTRGIPLRAERGSLVADAPARVTIPPFSLPPGSYRLSVHLAPRANPGNGIARSGDWVPRG